MLRGTQKSRRIRKRVEVRYGPEQPAHVGYSRNLSRDGMMVASTRVFAPGTILRIAVRFPRETYHVLGRVVWAREGSLQWLMSGRVGMGISFITPPADFLGLFDAPAGTG